jgi:hypothetical protein
MSTATTVTKKRKGTRLLKSPVAKVSITTLNAVAPLVVLRLAWKELLLDPSVTLTMPLLPSLVVLQTSFIVLLLPFYAPVSKTKKRNIVKMDSLNEAVKIKAFARLTDWQN